MGYPHGLTVSCFAKGAIEFRVTNPSLLEPNGRLALINLVHVGLIPIFVGSGFKYYVSHVYFYVYAIVVALYVYGVCTQVLHESIIVIPRYGVQLEVHRGLRIASFTLTKERHFIPLSAICDIVINEGLHRWNVRYYLCVIQDTGEKVTLDVIFKNILPRLPTLKYVYNEIHNILWAEE